MEVKVIITVTKDYVNQLKKDLETENDEYVKQIIRENIYDDAWDYLGGASVQIIE